MEKKKETKKKTITGKFIEIIEKLKKIGIEDFSLMVQKDTIRTLAEKYNIPIEEIIAIGLNPDEQIGFKKNDIIKAYRGKSTCRPPTDEEVRILKEEFGIVLDKEPKPRRAKAGKKDEIGKTKRTKGTGRKDEIGKTKRAKGTEKKDETGKTERTKGTGRTGKEIVGATISSVKDSKMLEKQQKELLDLIMGLAELEK